MTVVDNEVRLAPVDPDAPGDGFAHYARKADIVAAMVLGNEVVALCGYRWVPTRDPDQFPTCPACVKAFDALKAAGR